MNPAPADHGLHVSPDGAVSVRSTVYAPAKVNLSLLVGPPGADGYHPLFTVFVPLDLTDRLDVDLRVAPGTVGDDRAHGLEVSCPGVAQDDNLTTRALRLVEAETGWTFSGRVAVHKEIPKGAGLGGGSSDGAAALRLGAEFVAAAGGPALEGDRLHSLARSLGADVPFFLDPRPALAAGVGDVLEPLDLPALPLVLLLPRGELSTAEVYRTFDGVGRREPRSEFQERKRRAERAWKGMSEAWSTGSLDDGTLLREAVGLLVNDLEMASLHLMPELAGHRAELEGEDVLGTLMSGSGPTLFSLCSSPSAARAVAARLRGRGFLARALLTRPGRRA